VPARDPEVEAAAQRHLERVRSGLKEPGEALDDLLAETGARVGGPVRGWWLEGMRAEDLVLPDELLASGARRIGAAAGWYQPAGSPWGRNLVLILVLPPAVDRSVRRGAPAGSRT
jgi:hypothetical protein